MPVHKLRFIAAWLVGWFYYLLLAMGLSYQGGLEIPFQLVIGMGTSFCFLMAAFWIGLLLNISFLHRRWYRDEYTAMALIIVAFGILFFGEALGLSAIFEDPELLFSYRVLHPYAAIAGMFAAVFGTLHYPRINPNYSSVTGR